MIRNGGGAILSTVIQGLPLWSVWMLGLLYCLLEWKKAPRAAAMAAGGLALMAANWIAARLFYGVVLPRTGAGFFQYGRAGYMMVSFLFAAVEAAAVALLVVAVFQGRKAATVPPGQVS